MDLFLFYKQRVSSFQNLEEQCRNRDRKFPFYRLLTLIIGIVVFYITFQISIFISAILFLLFFFVFFKIVRADIKNETIMKEFQLLKTLNEEEINSLNGTYNFPDDGSRYQNENHPYSYDLDLFGNSSLFHYINRTTFFKSSYILSDWLLAPANTNEIKERNDAVIELSKNIDWRQKIFVQGYSLDKNNNSFNKLIHWIKNTDKFSFSKNYILFCSALSGLTFFSFGFALIYSVYYIPAILLCIHFFIIQRSKNVVKNAHTEVTNNAKILESYADILKSIEQERFVSSKLNHLKGNLKSDHESASQEIHHLMKIVNSFDVRLNVYVHIILNSLFFWDIHQLYKLEKWKQLHKNIEQWFQSVGEIEALSSFSNLYFNNPNWCFPEINDNYFNLDTANLGHPLIRQNVRVCNDLSINKAGKILLLSGSNMSGKSTFLRAVGVNLILAMAGSCVCAEKFIFSPVRIFSSMKITDSLKDNTSSFFAELKKLETIIKEVNKNEKVFLLLDEILRGTNSIDRHIGSTALIKQLIANNAVGIVATHDLALTEMCQEFPENIENYNFNININNDELYFDYLLNKGVCTSRNASILMKKIGINIV